MSKGIFVVMEQRYGKVQNVGLELVGESTRLKEDLKDEVVAVLLVTMLKAKLQKSSTMVQTKLSWLTTPCWKTM